jgi:tetratricopeptide (TPR) repeat protein
MAKIPLRTYTRTIDDLIETHKYNEAILHGKNVLFSFPKHIDTYRLLGKALLESRQNDSAAIFFDRILSVFPDDFIANLGLSYVLETRNDLNQSVSHMELAFELQPANESIQEELKRLYKQRDGVEPARVRLTRGALIKMYARSNLHQQAIAEARVALHEHPDRIDFEIILAKMLALAGESIDAVESCLKIVSKLPYCFDANLILFQILPENSEKYDISAFHERLVEIDPYYKYVSKHRPDVYSIPEVAVSIEELQEPFSESAEGIQWSKLIDEIWRYKGISKENDNPEEEINWDDVLSEHADIFPESTVQPSQQEKVEESTEIEPVPDWLDVEEPETERSDHKMVMDESMNSKDESGMVDRDSPVIESDEKKDLPSSIWIQEPGLNAPEEKELSLENVKNDSIKNGEEKIEDDLKSDQYFEVVLKDAHDAFLSGFADRAIEGYRQLLQENRVIDKAVEQLKNDLSTFPSNFNLWIILGDAYQRLGKATEALEAYQNAEKFLGS